MIVIDNRTFDRYLALFIGTTFDIISKSIFLKWIARRNLKFAVQ